MRNKSCDMLTMYSRYKKMTLILILMTLVSNIYAQSVLATSLTLKCDTSVMLEHGTDMDCETSDLSCQNDCFNNFNSNLLALFSAEPSINIYLRSVPFAVRSRLSSTTLKILSPPRITG